MIKKLDYCPHCESSDLHDVVYSDDIEFRGKTVRVDNLHVYSCAACGEEFMTATQFKENGLRIATAKAAAVDDERKELGLLQAEEVKRIRELFGLTQKVAAQVFGGGANAFSKYERGEGKQSDAMDRLLRVAAAVPAAAQWLFAQYADDPTSLRSFEMCMDDGLATTQYCSFGTSMSLETGSACAWDSKGDWMASALALVDVNGAQDLRNQYSIQGEVVWKSALASSSEWQEFPMAA